MVTHWLAELDGRRVTVEAPASSANLGAGYDCLGLALGLVNRVEVEVRGWSRGKIELSVEGEGVGHIPLAGGHAAKRGEVRATADLRAEIMSEAAQQWVRYGEYVTVEIDTDAKTATVVKEE